MKNRSATFQEDAMSREKGLTHRLDLLSLGRRDFYKFCGHVASILGLGESSVTDVADVLTSERIPRLVWFHYAPCIGCTEAFLNDSNPWIDAILLNTITVELDSIVLSPSRQLREIGKIRSRIGTGEYICVIEGSLPSNHAAVRNTMAGNAALQTIEEVCSRSIATVLLGDCSRKGSHIASLCCSPYVGDHAECPPEKPVVHVPGCPPDPSTFVASLTNILLTKRSNRIDETYRWNELCRTENHSGCVAVESGRHII